MTDTPLSPELVDELLSAELDGEFDAAARDLGLDPEAARAQLDAMPGVADRRAALAQAASALAVPALSDAAREHLVRVALDAGPMDQLTERRDRRRKLLTVGGSIAAACLVVVGAVAVFNGSDTERGNDSTAAVAGGQSEADSGASDTTVAAAAAPDAASPVAYLDLGAIADEDQLRAVIGQNRTTVVLGESNRDLATGDVSRDDGAGSDANVEQEASGVVPPAAVSSLPPSRDAYDAATGSCVTRLAAVADGTLALVGTATYAGQPALVTVFDRPDGSEIVVTKADDCTRLVTIPLDR